MKTAVLSLLIIFIASTSWASGSYLADNKVIASSTPDSLKLISDINGNYYQKIVKVSNNISDSSVYIKILEFMASKNIQQSYADDEGRKLIFTTSQDLNTNLVYIGDDTDIVDAYTAQFAIIIDLKSHRYRYTINNVVFYRPTPAGSRRLTLDDMYLKVSSSTKRVAKDAKKLLDSFERYLTALTSDLNKAVQQKSIAYNSNF
jgi:hypothetical protein